jgi:hypothetical protein
MPGGIQAICSYDSITLTSFVSAAARRSSIPSAVNPRSGFVAHSHALTRTASACRVSASTHAHKYAARLESSIASTEHSQTNSTLRKFQNDHLPISLINSSFRSAFDLSNTSSFKPFEPLAGIDIAQIAIEFIVDNSSVIADQNVTLLADRNSTIESAQNTAESEAFKSVKKSGIMGSGGVGVFIGSKSQSNDLKQQNVTNTGSTIGSLGGNVTILAGEKATVQGSQILTPGKIDPATGQATGAITGGNITLLAKDIAILDVQNTAAQQTESKTRQSGLTVSVGSPLISAAQTLSSTAKAVQQTSNGRAQALGAASAALYAYNNKDAIEGAAKALGPNGDITKAGSISLSLGSARSQSNSSATSATSAGSELAAGGNITLAATGGGKDSNLLISGSQVRGDINTTLQADNQITLKAGENTASLASSNTSRSGAIGLTFSTQGISADLSASRARGNSDGSDISYSNTQVAAGNNLTITSGGSTTLSGANIAANSVKADIGKTFGGDLIIESLQDKSIFAEKSKSSGGSITIGPGGVPTGASISSGRTNINSNFQSVSQQSGIQAGDGGFQVNVAGNTTLKGGVITSTQTAVDNKLNSFNTGTRDANGNLAAGTGKLTITDIQNTASYSAKSSNFSAGFSVGEVKDKEGNTVRNPDGSAQTKTTPIGSAGIGSASGNASSVTIGGITGVAGDKSVLTGKDTTNALRPIFNADTVKKDINAQVQITSQFGSQASTAIGNYAAAQMKDATDLRIRASKLPAGEQRDRLNNEAKAIEANWGDQGILRLGAHTVVGGLTGGAGGAAGAGATTVASPLLYNALRNAGVPAELATGITLLGGSAIGAAAGGTAGAAAGLNEVANNYLTSAQQGQLSVDIRSCGKDSDCQTRVVAKYEQLSVQNDRALLAQCAQAPSSPECTTRMKDSISYAATRDVDAFGMQSDRIRSAGVNFAQANALPDGQGANYYPDRSTRNDFYVAAQDVSTAKGSDVRWPQMAADVTRGLGLGAHDAVTFPISLIPGTTPVAYTLSTNINTAIFKDAFNHFRTDLLFSAPIIGQAAERFDRNMVNREQVAAQPFYRQLPAGTTPWLLQFGASVVPLNYTTCLISGTTCAPTANPGSNIMNLNDRINFGNRLVDFYRSSPPPSVVRIQPAAPQPNNATGR